MLTKDQLSEISLLVESSLDSAENNWNKIGTELIKGETGRRTITDSYMPSDIPGHSIVHSDNPIVDEFVVLVADMRQSSQHLMCAISPKKAKVSQLERVYYETSALLPALAKTVQAEGGNVTEYLGDGVLALFQRRGEKDSKTLYAALSAARSCIGPVRTIVKRALNSRYKLSELDLGVGMALSKAVVTMVGLPDAPQPKVFGECVFRATKLSKGLNEILVDKQLRLAWPTADDGSLKFSKRKFDGFDGYLIMT